MRFFNCAHYFPEQIGIQLVRKKARKDTGKATVLVSASKLNKHLLEDPMNIGRREGKSICSSISPGGKGELSESVQGCGGRVE